MLGLDSHLTSTTGMTNNAMKRTPVGKRQKRPLVAVAVVTTVTAACFRHPFWICDGLPISHTPPLPTSSQYFLSSSCHRPNIRHPSLLHQSMRSSVFLAHPNGIDDNNDAGEVEVEETSSAKKDANTTSSTETEPILVVSSNNISDTARNPTKAWQRRALPSWISAANKNNPLLALWQAAVDRYWEEFRVGGGGSSDATAATTMDPRQRQQQQQQLPLAIQLQNLLVALSNAADEGGNQYNLPPMSVVEAWKESLGYNSNDVSGSSTQQKGPTTVVDNSKNNYDPSNRTNVEAWKDSWNRGMTNDNVRDVGNHIWRYLLGDWSKVRRNYLLLAAVRAVCVAVLTWGCVDMILTSLTVSGVWTWTSLTQPMQAALSWQAILHPIRQHRKVLFLQSYNTLRLRIDPILFALKALGTLISVSYYENLVCTVEAVLLSKDFRTRYPLVSRLYGLLLSYFLAFGFVRVVTVAGIYTGTVFGFAKQLLVSSLFAPD